MAQPLARDEQGNVWDISDPAHPKFVSHGGASPLASPSLPYEAPQAQANLARTQQEVRQAEATASATTAKTKAEATSAELAAKTAAEQYAINHPGSNGTEGMSGPQYLQFLQKTDPGRAAYIQGLSEGRVPFPSPQMMRTPAGQALLTQVMRADPTIDATNYTTRAAARKNAATGTLSQSDNALVTAIGHAARLEGLAPQVAGHNFTPLNTVENFLGSITGGKQPAYDQNAQLLGDEVAAAYGTNSQGKQNEAGSQFSSSLSTGQKRDNILGAIDLISSKLAANRAQFAYGNGQLGKPDFMLLPAETRQELLSIPGAAQIVAKHFSGIPVMGANGNVAPPGASPPSSGFTPPPTGPTNGGIGPSTNGFSETPDPQSADFWATAARNQVPYRDALSQWQGDVKARGLVGITPPPPQAYHHAASYIRDNPNVPYQPFSSVTRQSVNPVQQAVTDAAFSGPGVAAGHAVNAAAGSIPTLLAGDQGARYNAVSGALHPNYALGGDVAGTIAGVYGAAKGVGAVAPSLGRFGAALGGNPARAALTGDSLFFGGSGAAQNPDNPIGGAGIGIASALAGNAAGRFVIGPALKAALDTGAAQKGISAAKGMFGGSAFSPPVALDAGQNLLFKRIAGDPFASIQGNLQDAANLNLPYSLADANPQLRALAGSAARKNPDVMAMAENVLQPRQTGQAERAINQIGTNLAPIGDVPTLQANLLKRAQAVSAPLYDAAKSQPTPELTAHPALKDVLDRPAAQTAIRKGYETALNNGEDVGSLTYATDPQGNPVQYGNPSWNVIHYARQALDASGETPVRRALDKQIAGINPGFKAADAAYAGILKGSDALQSGVDATKIGTTPEMAQSAVTGAGDNLPQFQQGYASNLADMIGRRNLSTDPYKAVYGSPFQRQNMGIVFPRGSSAFDRANSLEGDMAKTYQGVLGNSATAARTEADKAFDNAEIATDLGMAAATHGASLPGLAMTGLRRFANSGADSLRMRMSSAKAGQIGPLLLNTDPNANMIMMNNIADMGAARQAYLQRLAAASGNLGAGMFGAPILYGASGQ